MNKKRTLIIVGIYLIVGILFTININADLTTDLHSYYSFDNDCETDDISGYNGVNNGAIQSSGVLNNACYFDGTNDFINLSSNVNASIFSNAFTINFWAIKNASKVQTMFYTGNSADTDYFYIYYNDFTPPNNNIVCIIKDNSDVNSVTSSSNHNNDVWVFVSCRLDSDGHINDFRTNNNTVGNDASPSPNPTLDYDMYIGAYYFAGLGAYFGGSIDELSIYTRELNDDEIGDLYNYGAGYNPVSMGGGADTTPPSITNVNQDPDNVTVLNALVRDIYINSTITDNINLNISTVKINWTIANVSAFIGGVNVTNIFNIIDYNDTYSNLFNWYIGEEYYLGYTTPIAHEQFILNPILNNTLSTNAQWVKMKFTNITTAQDLYFVEIYDTNTTTNADYHFCNNNYTSGNIDISEWCTDFYFQTGNDLIRADNGKYHRILPLNIVGNTINNIIVTPTSYILKRGSSSGETYFYISNDTSSTQTTINNGQSWTNRAYTLDAQLHFTLSNSTFFYEICAEDNSSNKQCSGIFNDTIDFPKFPPTQPIIYNPIAYNSYNNSILINHSASTSPTGQTIVSYELEYRKNTSSSWIQIKENNYPSTTYNWDISNILNGEYYIKITVNDSIGLESIIISNPFTILNEESLNTQLLSDLNDWAESIYNLIDEVIGMLFEIIFIGLFLVLAMIFRKPLLLSLSGIGFVLISLRKLVNNAVTTDYDLILGVMSLVLAFTFIIGGAVWFWIKTTKEQTEKEKKGRLKRIYN